MSKELTAERLREILDYDAETGVFTWKVCNPQAKRMHPGDEAGSKTTIKIDGKGYAKTRLAWLHYYGVWPSRRVVRKDGKSLSINNLELSGRNILKDVRFPNDETRIGQSARELLGANEDRLTRERLLEKAAYDRTTGVFVRRSAGWGIQAGQVMGSINKQGYRMITVDGIPYLAHRLAWLYEYGEWPNHQVDHVNGNRDDNSIGNLRRASSRQQSTNRAWKAGRSGYRNVVQVKNRWQARLTVDGRSKSLGYFDDPKSASEVVESKRAELFGEFNRRQ